MSMSSDKAAMTCCRGFCWFGPFITLIKSSMIDILNCCVVKLSLSFCKIITWFDLMIYCVYCHFQQYFSYIMASSFSGGRSRSTRREPPTMGKQLVNFITCSCKSSAPLFCNFQSRVWTHAVLVIGLFELLDNPTT
jgi:hypothetical protein